MTEPELQPDPQPVDEPAEPDELSGQIPDGAVYRDATLRVPDGVTWSAPQ